MPLPGWVNTLRTPLSPVAAVVTRCHPGQSEGSECLRAPAIPVWQARTQIPRVAQDDKCSRDDSCFVATPYVKRSIRLRHRLLGF